MDTPLAAKSVSLSEATLSPGSRGHTFILTVAKRLYVLQMLKRHSVAPGTPVSPYSGQRRSNPKQARIKSWWLRLLLVCLTGVVGWQAWRLLVAGHQLNPYFSQLSHETVHWSWRKPTCPLEYKRHQWADIQAGRKRPYLFGGQQEPECTNCEVDALWSHFCQFKSHVGCQCHPVHLFTLTTRCQGLLLSLQGSAQIYLYKTFTNQSACAAASCIFFAACVYSTCLHHPVGMMHALKDSFYL